MICQIMYKLNLVTYMFLAFWFICKILKIFVELSFYLIFLNNCLHVFYKCMRIFRSFWIYFKRSVTLTGKDVLRSRIIWFIVRDSSSKSETSLNFCSNKFCNIESNTPRLQSWLQLCSSKVQCCCVFPSSILICKV